MTLGGVRDFFRTRLDGLGYTEWGDGFSSQNIPSTLIDKSYFLEVGKIISRPANQLHHTFSYPLKIYVFLKGFRDPSAAIDNGLADAHLILDDILDKTVRLQTNGLKDIRPVSIDVKPLSDSNDNNVVIEMEFDNLLMFTFYN